MAVPGCVFNKKIFKNKFIYSINHIGNHDFLHVMHIYHIGNKLVLAYTFNRIFICYLPENNMGFFTLNRF